MAEVRRGNRVPRAWAISGRTQPHRTTDLRVAPEGLEIAAPIFLAASGDPEWKQYVPLFTVSLVLLDLALGRPVVNAITSIAFGKAPDASADPAPPTSAQKPTSNARIDTDALVEEARKVYEETALTQAYVEKMTGGVEGDIEKMKKRLARQMKDQL
eukprot:CAMPEP_0172615814 /NCGR_PEP_ID=MMETSP1068-20121228/62522_1 /TAXON_ID=35684 /ORGANISM="Pseudopedinella elastica, Strain CCMP716" /LENGTH=156 /DNA_ID=CAMNT_0013421075 /DNA_START=111 /DNA_END=581 /DNA_ORIENTATION=+